jgi:hypothetical protein
MNPAPPPRGRYDAMTIYGVKRLFKNRRPGDVASMMGKAGFVTDASGDGTFITMRDAGSTRDPSPLSIRWYCTRSAAGTEVLYFADSALRQQCLEAFLDAVADGDLDSIPELVAAMRLTATQDGPDGQ